MRFRVASSLEGDRDRRLTTFAKIRFANEASYTLNNPIFHTKVLVDSGASDSFIDRTYAFRTRLPLFTLTHAMDISLADGNSPRSGSITQWTLVNLKTQKTETTVVLFVIDSPGVNIILGNDWLTRINPRIDWRTGEILSVDKVELPIKLPQSIPMYERYLANNVRLLTASKFSQIRNRDPIYVMTITPNAQPLNSKDTKDTKAPPTIPSCYRQFQDVFQEKTRDSLPDHRDFDLKIELLPGSQPKGGPMYRHTVQEDIALKEYLLKHLAMGTIRKSTSSCSAPVLFSPKKNGDLRLCVDYRALNAMTHRNKYPLPLIDDVLDSLSGSKYFTTMDLKDGYNNLRVAAGYEWLTAFRTKYGLFEYTCVPFGLTNAPAAFQAFMDNIFADLLYKGVVVYLDDIMIYSRSMDEHEALVKEVLHRLRNHNLSANLSKCHFHKTSVDFLGHIISYNGVQMDPAKIKTINEWPAPKNVKEVQMFLGLCNYYRTFIPNFSKRTMAMTELLKKDVVFNWNKDCSESFMDLKSAFTTDILLAFPNAEKPYIVETDASGYAIGGILSQENDQGNLRPIAFYSRKFNSAERNYEVYDQELLAIKECFAIWRQYLLGAKHKVQVYSDHRNLQWFSTTRQLNRRQVRWSMMFADFDFEIIHRPGSSCKPDAISRRPDYFDKNDHLPQPNVLLKPELFRKSYHGNQGITKEPIVCYDILLHPSKLSKVPIQNNLKHLASITMGTKGTNIIECIRKEQQLDPLVQTIKADPLSRPKEIDRPISCINRLLYVGNRLYVPESCQLLVLQDNHDHIAAGHPGINNTMVNLQRFYWWPRMIETVQKYVSSCNSCQRNKTHRNAPPGLLQPLPIPRRPWSSISMDFAVDLPLSNGFTNCLIIVCRQTKMAHFVPIPDIQSNTTAQYFLDHVVKLHGLPDDITTDRDSAFTSQFWKTLSSSLNIKLNLSTAFHQQTDGQSENAIQQLKQYLRHYIDYSQDDWTKYISMAEFSHNSRINSSTKATPFEANYGFLPSVTNRGISINSSAEATNYITKLTEIHQALRTYLSLSQEKQKHFADKKRSQQPKYKIGDLVMLSTKNLRMDRPSKKLSEQRIGPFPIIAQKNETSFQLKLPTHFRIHDTFHVSLLTPYKQNTFKDRIKSPPNPVKLQGYTEYEVDAIVDSRYYYRKLQYLIDWRGYGPDDRTWEPLDSLTHCSELLYEFHQRHPGKPGHRRILRGG